MSTRNKTPTIIVNSQKENYEKEVAISKKLISHFDMNVFSRVVLILSQLTAFVLELQQKNNNIS